MRRRTVLARSCALATLAGTGLAGCSSSQSADADCPSPSTDDVRSLLPDGLEGFERGDTSLFEDTPAETAGEKTQVLAEYDGPDGTYWVTIATFPTAEDASREFEAFIEQDSPGRGAVGYLRVEDYLYGAGGSSESEVTRLLGAAEPLTDDCVSANVEWM